MSAFHIKCRHLESLRRFFAQTLQHFKFVSDVGNPISGRDVTIPLNLCEPFGAEVYMGRKGLQPQQHTGVGGVFLALSQAVLTSVPDDFKHGLCFRNPSPKRVATVHQRANKGRTKCRPGRLHGSAQEISATAHQRFRKIRVAVS